MIALTLVSFLAFQNGWDERLLPLAYASAPTGLRWQAFRCGSIDLMDRQESLAERFYVVRQRISARMGGEGAIARYIPPLATSVDSKGQQKCLSRDELTQILNDADAALTKLERNFPASARGKRK